MNSFSDPAALGPGVASGHRFSSRDEILERSARAAAALAGVGVAAGDAVAVMLRNDIAFFEATLAAGALGAYPVPVNWHYRAGEAGYILADSDPKAVVAHADLIPQITDVVPPEVTLVGVRTPPEIQAAYDIPLDACQVPAQTLDWDGWLDAHPPLAGRRQAPSSMIYTSGTTGRPKGVRRAPYGAENLPALAELSRQVLGIEAGMRTVIPAPLYHTAPNTYAMAALLAGGTLALQARFDPAGLLQLIATFGVTHLQVVPTMFSRLLRLPEPVRNPAAISSLRHVVHAAAPCPAAVKAAMIDWWGPIITEYYGCTESGIITACTSQQWLSHRGSVGPPVTGAQVQVLDEQHRPVAAGTPGEVWVRHQAFGRFDYHRADTGGSVDRDGWVSCGDVGYLDTDGYLYLCDRKADTVIIGGANVYPAEVEAVLVGLEGVADCAVFGIPDDDLGEVLAAAIETEPGADLDQQTVVGFLRARLAGIKIPRVVTFHQTLPREDSGKIFKRRLREPYWQGRALKI